VVIILPKAKNKLADEAFALYRQGLKLKEIAKKLNVPDGTVRRWKHSYNWDSERSEKEKANVRKKGAPPNNKNAVGCGAPEKNTNAVKHGLFQRYLPKDTLDIIEGMQDKSPLDILWESIQIQYAAIIRAQQIMYVKDKDDSTSTQIGFTEGKTSGETWEVQQAWDKQANFLKAQSTAIASLKNMIKDYLELEGASKADAKEQVQDWKAAIIEIAKRRGEKSSG
jgi:uncharacterized protein YjcR